MAATFDPDLGILTFTHGVDDTDRGIFFYVAGEAFPRVHVTPQGEVLTGDGTGEPAASGGSPEGYDVFLDDPVTPTTGHVRVGEAQTQEVAADFDTALGHATNTGLYGTAIGTAANAEGTSSVAIGVSAHPTGASGVAIGPATQTVDGVAIGNGTHANGAAAVAIGQGASAPEDDSVAIGHGATTSAAKQISLGAGASDSHVQMDVEFFSLLYPLAAAPAAPASGVRVFLLDIGGGKTALKARFPTGAEQTLATEP